MVLSRNEVLSRNHVTHIPDRTTAQVAVPSQITTNTFHYRIFKSLIKDFQTQVSTFFSLDMTSASIHTVRDMTVMAALAKHQAQKQTKTLRQNEIIHPQKHINQYLNIQ